MRQRKTVVIVTCDVCGGRVEDGEKPLELKREVPCYHNDTSLEPVEVDLCNACKARLYKEVERMQRERKKEKARG